MFLLKLINGAVCCRLLPFGAVWCRKKARISGLLDSWIAEENAKVDCCMVAWLHGRVSVFDGSIFFGANGSE